MARLGVDISHYDDWRSFVIGLPFSAQARPGPPKARASSGPCKPLIRSTLLRQTSSAPERCEKRQRSCHQAHYTGPRSLRGGTSRSAVGLLNLVWSLHAPGPKTLRRARCTAALELGAGVERGGNPPCPCHPPGNYYAPPGVLTLFVEKPCCASFPSGRAGS